MSRIEITYRLPIFHISDNGASGQSLDHPMAYGGSQIKGHVFDVSGVNGVSGTSGDSFYSTASDGSDGRDGGYGEDGQCGRDAGTIAMRLSTPETTAGIPKNVVLPHPIDVDVKLDASIKGSGGQLQKMDTILKINAGELMFFLALGGHGGHGGNGGNGEDGGTGFRYGASLILSFNESVSEYPWSTVERMQLDTKRVLMAVVVVTEEMAVTRVKVVMVDLEEPFESLLSKPTLISLCSIRKKGISF